MNASGEDLSPEYYTGSAGGQWALTDGYLRSREGINYTGVSIERTTGTMPSSAAWTGRPC